MADPDLQIWGAGGGRGRSGYPDPEIRRSPGLKKLFAALRASVCGLNLGELGGGGTCPGSATAISLKIYWGIQLSRKVPRLFPRAPNTIKPFVTPLPSDIWRERGGGKVVENEEPSQIH